MLESYDFAVILDEVYLGIHYSTFYSILQYATPRLLASCFLILSCSKGLGAMPGARAAWLTCFDTSLIAPLVKVQSGASANASTIAQMGLQGSLEAIMKRPQYMNEISSYYKRRVDYVISRLKKLNNSLKNGSVTCSECYATFYVWAKFNVKIGTDVELVSFLRDKSQSDLISDSSPIDKSWTIDSKATLDQTLSHDVLQSEIFETELSAWDKIRPSIVGSLPGSSKGVGIATVPGSAFLMKAEEKYIRFSCARASLPELRLAMDVLETAIIELDA